MPITSLQGLLKRTQQIAKEQSNLLFDEMPYAHVLCMGWYPGRMLMQQEVEGRLKDALPNITGVVIPYYKNLKDLSHLVIYELTPDLKLNYRKKAVIPFKAKMNHGRLKGIFGMQRLEKAARMSIQVCQNELVAARLPNGVTLTGPDKELGQMLAERVAKVNLVGESPAWYDQMMALSKKAGIDLTIDGQHVAEYYHTQLYKMFTDGLGTSAVATRIQEVLAVLMPADARMLLSKLETTTKFDVSRLLPGDLRLYRNEREFYEEVEKELSAAYAVELLGDRLFVKRKNAKHEGTTIPVNAELLGHFLAHDLGYLDLLEWAQAKLRSVPHFYMYRKERLEPRYDVSVRIAQVALSVLMKQASKGATA